MMLVLIIKIVVSSANQIKIVISSANKKDLWCKSRYKSKIKVVTKNGCAIKVHTTNLEVNSYVGKKMDHAFLDIENIKRYIHQNYNIYFCFYVWVSSIWQYCFLNILLNMVSFFWDLIVILYFVRRKLSVWWCHH